MSKYRVECGAFVTKFVMRHEIVHANSPDEAAEKAKYKFQDAIFKQGHDVESVGADFVEEVEE